MIRLLIPLISVLLFSCAGKKNSSVTFQPSSSDTSRPLVVFFDQSGVRRFDAAYRVVIDTFKVTKQDGKLVTTPVRDSFYYPPIVLKATDSLGKILKSVVTGQDSLTIQNIIWKKEDIIFDTGIDYGKIDSILRAGNKAIVNLPKKQ